MNSKRKSAQKAAKAEAEKERVEKAMRDWKAAPPIKLGEFTVPKFDGPSVIFGADFGQYPPEDMIPKEFQQFSGKFPDIVGAIFYRGGKLEDHGIRLKPDINKTLAMAAIRAWLASFAPKHEIKVATVAWALSEWTEDVA